MHRWRAAAPLLLLVALAGCSASPPIGGGAGGDLGLVVVTAGGSALEDGAADVPPTLQLGLEGDGITPSEVSATLDGHRLPLVSSARGLAATVAPMAYASRHQLVLDVAGRPAQDIGFTVVDRSGVSAAAWLDQSGQVVCDVVFEWAPDQAQVAAALPQARLSWSDGTHLRLAWATPPPSLSIPAGLAAAHGSVLQGPLQLPLTGLHPGGLRRVTVPPPPALPPVLPITLWTVPTAASHNSLRQHAAAIAIVSPTGWQAQADGSLTGAPDPVAVATAEAAHRPDWPVLSNPPGNPAAIAQLLGDQGAESRLIQALAAQVRSLGLAGVNLDFEGVPGSDQSALTSFSAQLAAALHGEGAGLSVDVVPHAPGALNSASAAYDDAALASAADRLVVMTYDQHFAPDDPGPVAGLDWQAEELAGTLQGVPRGKAVLGIPLYARRWSGDQVTALDYPTAIARALAEPAVSYDYDFSAASPVLRSDPGGVATELWFDDADSLLRKIGAVSRLGLAGVAAWRAGFEDPGFWSSLP